MAHWLKCLLYTREDWSSDLRNLREFWGILSAHLQFQSWKAKAGDPQGNLASWTNCIGKFWVSLTPCLSE